MRLEQSGEIQIFIGKIRSIPVSVKAKHAEKTVGILQLDVAVDGVYAVGGDQVVFPILSFSTFFHIKEIR